MKASRIRSEGLAFHSDIAQNQRTVPADLILSHDGSPGGRSMGQCRDMHELALCRRLIATIEDQATVHGYRRVKTVRLAIGPFAAVEHEALRYSFGIAAMHGPANGATLEIREEPAEGMCTTCQTSVPVSDYGARCVVCGGALSVTGGTTMKITELEVV